MPEPTLEERFGAKRLVDKAMADFKKFWQEKYKDTPLTNALTKPGHEDVKIVALLQWMHPQAVAKTREEVEALRQKLGPKAFIAADFALKHSFLGPLITHREGHCVAYTALFVAMARRLGIEAGAAEVIKNFEGKYVYGTHVCPYVKIGWFHQIVVDPLAPFVKHKKWRPITDNYFHAGAWCNLANDLLKGGKLEKGLMCVKKALEIERGHPRALQSMGDYYERMGDMESALKFYKEAAKDRRNYQVRALLGSLLCRVNRVREGVKHLNYALKLKPDFDEVRMMRMVAYLKMGRFDKAADDYIKLEKSKAILSIPQHEREKILKAIEEHLKKKRRV